MSEVTLAAVCMNVVQDKAANLERRLGFIGEAAGLGARLIVFPEVLLQGHLTLRGAPSEPEVIELTRYYRTTAETVPGPTTELIGERAARHNMYIQIGALIGYAMCFPETVRTYAVRGAVLASMSTAWPLKEANAPDPEADYYACSYDRLSRAHAIANRVFFISSNQVGPTRRFDYYGHSRVISPTGKVPADGGREEKLIFVMVAIERGIEIARTDTLFFKNLLRGRRPETHGVLTQP